MATAKEKADAIKADLEKKEVVEEVEEVEVKKKERPTFAELTKSARVAYNHAKKKKLEQAANQAAK